MTLRVCFSTATVKNAVWSSFVNVVRFYVHYSVLFVFLLILGFRFYSVFMCVCFSIVFYVSFLISVYTCFYVLHWLHIQ